MNLMRTFTHTGILAVILVTLALCSGAACRVHGSQPPSDPGSASPTVTPRTVAALVASPTTSSFDVRFQWSKGVPGGGSATWAWRQREGVRRFDQQIGAKDGVFTMERDFPADVRQTVPSSVSYCWWFHVEDRANPRVTCNRGSGATDVEGPLEIAMDIGTVTGEIDDRDIAGHAASCYEFMALTPGVICVDKEGVPLYFSGSTSQSQPRVEIEATDVFADVPDLIPADLPYDVNPRDAPEIPISVLQLPE